MLDVVIRGGSIVDGTGAPARPRRRRHPRRADRRGRRDRRARDPGDRRRRQDRRARLRRRPHALRRAGVLRHHAEPVTAPRRDDRDRRELRLHDRAARSGARRLPHAHARPGRRHVGVRAGRRRAVGLEVVRRLPRPDRRHARAQRRLPRRALDDPPGRDGRARDPGARPPPRTSRRWSNCSPRAWPRAGSASRRRGRARTTTPTATWCRPATRTRTNWSRCARSCRGSRARRSSSSRASASSRTTPRT